MTYAPVKFEVAMSNGLEETHLQEIFDLTLTQGHMKQCPLHHVTYLPAYLKLLRPTVKEMHLQENTLFDFDQGQGG